MVGTIYSKGKLFGIKVMPYCLMHVFFSTGRESKARELLALPWTNINAQYANGNTPLILAVQGTCHKIGKLSFD